MGKGVALAIREAYPIVSKQYFAKFARKIQPELLGAVQLVQINEQLDVANLFIQVYYGKTLRCYNDSPQQLNYGALDKCLDRVFDLAQSMNRPLGLPWIGTNLAGGDKGIVRAFLEFYEKKYGIECTIYDPEDL
jgi:O-acetyl-ADP-ribose deacetylase (regulator of RNase III)